MFVHKPTVINSKPDKYSKEKTYDVDVDVGHRSLVNHQVVNGKS